MIYHQIEESRNIIKEIDENIAKQEKIKHAMTDTLVREIRSICMPLSSKMLRAAWDEQGKKTKKERPMFEFVKSEILTRFFAGVKSARLKQIVANGYEHYGYSFNVDVDGVTLAIFVPNVKKIDANNLNYSRDGMYAVLRQMDAVRWETLAESYREEKILDAIREFLESMNK